MKHDVLVSIARQENTVAEALVRMHALRARAVDACAALERGRGMEINTAMDACRASALWAPEAQASALLPAVIRYKALWNEFGEYSWRSRDLEEVFESAVRKGCACIDGWIHLETSHGPVLMRDLGYGPFERGEGEAWDEFVNRSAQEMRTAIARLQSDPAWLSTLHGLGLPEHGWELDEDADGLGVWFVIRFLAQEAG